MRVGGLRAAATLAVAFALAGALAGCDPSTVPTGSPTPSPTASTTPVATATATPTPEPVALTLPGCEDLLTLAQAREYFADATEFFGELSLSGSGFMVGSDPAGAAASAADPYRGCAWGVPNSDGAFFLYVGVLDPSARAALESGLTAAGFTSATTGALTTFEGSAATDVNEINATHLVTGELWIAAESPGPSTPVAQTALDAVRAANPGAGL